MDTVNCPYCRKNVKINHDDGAHYDENRMEEMECPECDKYFMVSAYVLWSFDGHKADCLNDGEHDFKPSYTYPKCYTRMECTMCNEHREPTKEEKEKYNIPEPDFV